MGIMIGCISFTTLTIPEEAKSRRLGIEALPRGRWSRVDALSGQLSAYIPGKEVKGGNGVVRNGRVQGVNLVTQGRTRSIELDVLFPSIACISASPSSLPSSEGYSTAVS
jgi:hypothetical protein